MDRKFIKKYTRTSIITATVLAGIALLTLVMLVLLLNVSSQTKTLISFIFSVSLLLISTLSFGILQIKVFNDYKSQKKSLCAEGIFNICLDALIIIAAILFASLQAGSLFKDNASLSTIDIRYFIGVFLAAFTIYKGFMSAISIKEKRFNAWIEVATSALWLGLCVLTFVSIGTTSSATLTTIMWLFVAFSWAMIIANIVYRLISYVFKEPTYLETPEAIKLLERDEAERANRSARLSAMMGAGYMAPPIQAQPAQTKQDDGLETKLAKLDDLLKRGVITKEEYNKKREKLINDNL